MSDIIFGNGPVPPLEISSQLLPEFDGSLAELAHSAPLDTLAQDAPELPA